MASAVALDVRQSWTCFCLISHVWQSSTALSSWSISRNASIIIAWVSMGACHHHQPGASAGGGGDLGVEFFDHGIRVSFDFPFEEGAHGECFGTLAPCLFREGGGLDRLKEIGCGLCLVFFRSGFHLGPLGVARRGGERENGQQREGKQETGCL